MKKSCRVVILGRPNTGKSTLFNRLLGRRKALVHDFPGVTRDRNEEEAQWWVGGKQFPVTLIDTGGLGGDLFSDEIKKQVSMALRDADVVLFLLDAKAGLTPLDQELLREFKDLGQLQAEIVIGVVNKVDVEAHEQKAAEFYELGFDSLLTISAEHGRGIDDLQKAVADICPSFLQEPPPSKSKKEKDNGDGYGKSDDERDLELEPEREKLPPRIAVVGRPNVGKSTLVNTLTGQERMITSPIPGTTVDPVDSLVSLSGKPCILIDTAGIRRKNKTKQGIEVLSVVQTRKTLEKAEIAILVLDGSVGVSDQDQKIGALVEEVGCGIIIAVNKWDTHSQNQKFTKELAAERIRKEIPFLKYAPILFISALKGQGLDDLGELIEEILHQRNLKIPTHEFTEWIRQEAPIHNPMNAKFYLCHQTSRKPPTFVCHVNDPERVDISLSRHLVNALRERWGYMGSPVRMLFLESKGRKSLPRK